MMLVPEGSKTQLTKFWIVKVIWPWLGKGDNNSVLSEFLTPISTVLLQTNRIFCKLINLFYFFNILRQPGITCNKNILYQLTPMFEPFN